MGMSAPASETISRLKGAFTALVTPFRNGKVDEAALREMVELQVSSGIDGLVPVGTTGESPTLSYEEHNRVVRVVVEAARGRVPVLAGTGANSTRSPVDGLWPAGGDATSRTRATTRTASKTVR